MVYTDMERRAEIRRRVLVEQVSQRQILRETGMHWKTLQKILEHSEPPGYRRQVAITKPKIGPFLDRVQQILEDDRRVPRKQRHTAKRIFERIQQEGYTGGYTQVKEAVREFKQKGREVFVPLIHRPGEAQVDFGFALVNMAGHLRKLPFFVMTLPLCLPKTPSGHQGMSSTWVAGAFCGVSGGPTDALWRRNRPNSPARADSQRRGTERESRKVVRLTPHVCSDDASRRPEDWPRPHPVTAVRLHAGQASCD